MSTALKRSVAMILFGLFILNLGGLIVLAHGGEDHGDKKAPVVSAGSNMLVRVARAGDLEVVIKSPQIEPDKGISARVFVTRFATNEPVVGAKIVVVLQGVTPVEVDAVPSTTAGMYDVKLPPLPQGQYKLIARVARDGENKSAEYGPVEVAPLPTVANGIVASWARTALLVMAGLTVLGVLGLFIYKLVPAARRPRIREEVAAA